MEKIKFRDLCRETIEVIKRDKKMFGYMFLLEFIFSYFIVKERMNPINTIVYVVFAFSFFTLIFLTIVEITKSFCLKEEIIRKENIMELFYKKFMPLLKIELVQIIIMILVVIIMAIPLSLLIVFIGAKLTNVMFIFKVALLTIMAVPLMILSIMTGNSLQFTVLKGNNIVTALKNSSFLVKIDKKKAVVIGIKIYGFYYFMLILAFVIGTIFGALLLSGSFMVFSIMNTLVFHELIKENEMLFDEEYDELWEEN